MISRILARFLQEILWRVTLFVNRRLFHLRVHGKERLPRRGPYLLVSNHSSHLDGPAIMAAQGIHYRRVHPFGARDYFFRGRVRSWLAGWLLNMISIERDRLDLSSVKRCRKIAADGSILLIFPEGTRSLDGIMKPLKPGFGLIASYLGLPVVPVYIHGAYDALPKGHKWPRRGRIHVSFAKPFYPQSYRLLGLKRREIYARLAQDVSAAISELQTELLNALSGIQTGDISV
jgi:1-acyl-sn-glycerol-3-phosphate acyltransferase